MATDFVQQTRPQRPSLDPFALLYATTRHLPHSVASGLGFSPEKILIILLLGKKWFDCAECHYEQEDHPLLQSLEMTFVCKKCKKAFRKNATEFEEADEYCPHCDNHFVIEAKVPKPALSIEADDVRMNSKFIKDEREKQTGRRTIFDPVDDADKLG